MKDIPLCFRKHIVLFVAGLILSVLFGLAGCLMLVSAVYTFSLNYEFTNDVAFSLMTGLLPATVMLPLFATSIAGALMAGHHRRAYVTITEEGLTIHDVVLFGKVSHHRFAIKAAKRRGNDLVLSIWDREHPKEQRINLSLLEGRDVDTLLNWLEGQGVKVAEY